MSYPAGAYIDHAALAANFQAIGAATNAELIPIVKADAYGHGLDEVAATLEDCGARLIGIAQVAEALAYLRRRAHGPQVFAWIYAPSQQEDLVAAIRAKMHLAVQAPWQIDALAAAATTAGMPALVHLKVDTGMGRAGVLARDFPAFAERIATCEQLHVVGCYSHLACADSDQKATAAQIRCFDEVLEVARSYDFALQYVDLAASGGVLWHPEAHYTHVRPGIALYGIAPDDSAASEVNLQPVMTLQAELISVKAMASGAKISYGHTATLTRDTTLGIVPLGYADGIDRHASNRAEVTHQESGVRCPIVGRICMDQFIVDLGDVPNPQPGDVVTLWGSGGPSASDWARWAETIGYEITTRLGTRVPRIHQKARP